MSDETAMLVYLQEREETLQKQLKFLEQRAIELQQSNDKLNSPEFYKINADIKQIQSELKENKNEQQREEIKGKTQEEKDIDKREAAVNEKYNKEIKDTEKSLQQQIDYIEKKYDSKDEKETKTNELKDIIGKVILDIENERSNEIQKFEAERAKLNVVEQARSMEEKEQQRELESPSGVEPKLGFLTGNCG